MTDDDRFDDEARAARAEELRERGEDSDDECDVRTMLSEPTVYVRRT